jgi:ABC-2 type transport system permease protein
VRRYLALLGLQLRISLTVGAQYRWDFVLDGILSFVWTAFGLVPLYIALHNRRPVGGWSFGEALVVMAWFTVLKAVLDGSINPSLSAVVDQIRKGTLDFVLIKPVDAQFLVSTSKFDVWKVMDLLAGLAVFVWAFTILGRRPSAAGIALAALLIAAAVLVMYSLWILVIAAAFWVVRLDNLSHLFNSLFDFARWPNAVFPRPLRLVFTVVIPLALMTTYPAEALLQRLAPGTAFVSLLGALAFAAVARLIWCKAMARYTSASS